MVVNEQLQAYMQDYGNAHLGGVESEAYKNFNAVMTSSPHLIDQLNQLVANNNLTELSKLDPKYNAGAGYDTTNKIMLLNPDKFLNDVPKYESVFQVGHEAQHGFVNQARAAAETKFSTDMEDAVANNKDYEATTMIQARLDFDYKNEAEGMIAGWNAVVHAMKEDGEELTLESIYKDSKMGYSSYFLEEAGKDQEGKIIYQSKAGLEINQDLTIDMERVQNIAALETTYSKISGKEAGLGANQQLNYTDIYAADYIGDLCEAHLKVNPDPTQGAKLILDLKALGTSEESVEIAGMYITAPEDHPDIKQCIYYDPQDLEKPLYLDHTYEGINQNKSVPNREEQIDKEHLYESPDKGSLAPDLSANETAPTGIQESAIEISDAEKILGFTTGDPLVDRLLLSRRDPSPEAFNQASQTLFETPESQAFIQEGMVQAQLEQQQIQELEMQKQKEALQHTAQSKGISR